MNEIILATNNTGKIKELSELLFTIQCIPQHTLGISSVEETGLSFIENAIIKARHASLYADKPALADDSGLVVPALNGEPGIFSARYAGINASDQDNIQLLLTNMAHLKLDQRKAYFYCAIALIHHAQDPTPVIATGIFHGEISNQTSGDEGFGYDPVFYIKEFQCTAAQLPTGIKNTVSHRAQALKQLHTLTRIKYE
jgi:XTP/dITP diphosphohydrolase